MKKILIGIAVACISQGASAQTFTSSVTIRSIETLADSQTTFIRSANGGWGLAGCPGAQFLTISSDNDSYNALLATALTAQASGSSVTARGVCSSNNQSVIAERLRLDT